MRVPVLPLAVSVSVLAHLLALVSPAWQVPEDEDFGSSPLSAVLLAAPVGETAVPAKKRARKPAAPKKRAPPVADAPTVALGNTPTESAPAAPEGPPLVAAEQSTPSVEVAETAPVPDAQSSAPAQPAVAPSPPLADLGVWPKQGRVRYSSSYLGIPITGIQTWSRDDKQFTASLRGSIPIKGELIKQDSSGRIVAGRPVSDSFQEVSNGAQFETLFDVDANKVRQQRKGAPREVDTGGYALDMLALSHFMALQPVGSTNFDVFVVTFRGSVSRVTIEQRPANAIELPLGSINARQFHAEARNGTLKIDIWLSVDWNNAPVRIRVAEANGTYDLKAEEVEIDQKVVGGGARAPAVSE